MTYAELQTKADNMESAARGFYLAGEIDLAKFYKGAAECYRKKANNMIIGDGNGKE